MEQESKGIWRLHSGRTVELEAIRQWRPAGPLEGVPTYEMNEESVQDVVKIYGTGQSTFLVPPKQTPLRRSRLTPPNRPAQMILPAIAVAAEFESNAPVGNVNVSGWDKSRLSVIWYQDSWALPIDPDVIEHILGVDWDSLASNIVMPY